MHQKQNVAHFSIFFILLSEIICYFPAAHTSAYYYYFSYFCLGPDMDSNGKKVKFNWLQTALTPLARAQERKVGSVTPSPCKTSGSEQLRSTFPLSDSPGSTLLGSLSLDTPKRKAEVLNESGPSSGKARQRKLSWTNSNIFKTSVVSFYFPCMHSF